MQIFHGSSIFEGILISHPILVALLFQLREFLEFYRDTSWVEFILNTIIVLLISVFLLSFMTRLIRNKEKAALMTSFFLLMFFFYNDFKIFIFQFDPILSLIDRRHTFAMSLSVFLFIISCVTIFFSRGQFVKFNHYLTVLFAVYCLIKIGELHILARITNLNSRHYFINEKYYPLTPKDFQKKPDIYYIILDSYTSSKSLKKYWQYDNSSFDTFLREKGFFIAEDSLSPNRWTPLSLAQSLNFSPLNQFLHSLPEGIQRSLLYDMLKKNYVTASLIAIGYEFINLSIFNIAEVPSFYQSPELDIHSKEDRSFATALFNKTLLGTILMRQRALKDFSKINLSIIKNLKNMKNRNKDKPVFVYAHLNLPHWPYQFNRKGHITPIKQLRGTIKRQDLYLEQLIFTNQLVMDTMNILLSDRQNPPIIILQGDHGYRFLEGSNKEGSDKEKECWTILNAYFLPNVTYQLNNNISPINTFRVIFNSYFGTEYNIISN